MKLYLQWNFGYHLKICFALIIASFNIEHCLWKLGYSDIIHYTQQLSLSESTSLYFLEYYLHIKWIFFVSQRLYSLSICLIFFSWLFSLWLSENIINYICFSSFSLIYQPSHILGYISSELKFILIAISASAAIAL